MLLKLYSLTKQMQIVDKMPKLQSFCWFQVQQLIWHLITTRYQKTKTSSSKAKLTMFSFIF